MFTKLVLIGWMFGAGMFPAGITSQEIQQGTAGLQVCVTENAHMQYILQGAVQGSSYIPHEDALYREVFGAGIKITLPTEIMVSASMGYKYIKSITTLYGTPYVHIFTHIPL